MLALMPVRRAISFVPSSPAVGERVEHRERALDGRDVADGRLTGASRGTLLPSDFDMPLPGRQLIMIPASSRFVVVGAGMHGLSTAYHLAVELASAGRARGADIVVLEKSTRAPGATGIACGVVRNNYFQPAMSELMQACVEVWESDPEAYHYNAVGYIALGPRVQESDLDGRVRAPPANRLPLRAHRRARPRSTRT